MNEADCDDEPEGAVGERETDPRKVPVHYSALRQMARSAAHCKHAMTAPWGGGSLAMRMGTAGHAATFEPHKLVTYLPGIFTDKKGKTRPHGDRRDGEAWEQFKAKPENVGKVIVNRRERAVAEAIASALRNDPLAAPLLFGPSVVLEQEILWAVDGRECSSRPDARKRGVHVTELKVVRTGEPEPFLRTAIRSGHHGQVRFYDRADAYETGRPFDDPPIDLWVVAVESAPPYVVTTYKLDDTAKIAADRDIHTWWSKLMACEAINFYPGYSQSPWPFEVNDGISDLSDPPDLGGDDDNETIDWSA